MLPCPPTMAMVDMPATLRSRVKSVETRTFAIDMPTPFRGVTRREGMLLRGSQGWGEFSPFLDYGHDECAAWLRAARESADLPYPEPVRDRIPVNSIVPAVTPDRAAQIAIDAGCSTVKIKVAAAGESLGQDLARVAAVREALPDARIRVDANGGWDLRTAAKAVAKLDDLVGLEYVEQPCASVEDLAAMRRETSVPVAADESIRRASDPFRVRDLEAADIAVLKVQPLGGVRAALRIAKQIGIPVVVSSAVETSIGLAAGVALAAALPHLPYACGLGTAFLLDGDVVAEPLTPVHGFLPVTRPDLDEAAFAKVEANEEIADRWASRLQHVEDLAIDG